MKKHKNDEKVCEESIRSNFLTLEEANKGLLPTAEVKKRCVIELFCCFEHIIHVVMGCYRVHRRVFAAKLMGLMF